MQQNDFQRFRAVLNGMAKLYDKELDSVLLDAYWMALRPWSLGDFEAAAATLMETSRFMPRPVDFKSIRDAGINTASEMWPQVLTACVQWRDSLLSIDDRTDRAVAALGGYRAIAMADTEMALPHLGRRFIEIYTELTEVDGARESLSQLPSFGDNELLEDTTARGGFKRIGEI